MILVDAHVHLHARFQVPRLLSAAHRNLGVAALEFAPDEQPVLVLALAEQQGVDWFAAAHRQAEAVTSAPVVSDGTWSFHKTEEDESLIALGPGEEQLILIAGRQIVTAERLELLALGTREPFADGIGLRNLVAQVNKTGGVAVIPWGFGKWAGKRGACLREFLSQPGPPRVFLGDNAGRPGLFPTPKEFGLAAAQGIAVLPGSDPLPLEKEERGVGAQGFSLEGQLDGHRPAAGLKRLLLEPGGQITPFGRRESLGRFLRNQARLRLRR